MKFKLTKPIPKVGDVRLSNRFALFPVKVFDYIVWLEKYQIQEEFKLTRQPLDIGKVIIFVDVKKWVVTDKWALRGQDE